MIELIKISTFDLSKYIRIAYDGDVNLLEKYHLGKRSLNGAVKSTLRMIEITEDYEKKKMEHYAVLWGKDNIGYVSTFPNLLYSFGINKEYRNEDIKQEWWEKVCEILENKFITMLYPNNTRAINFCKNKGMVDVSDEREEFVTLLNV